MHRRLCGLLVLSAILLSSCSGGSPTTRPPASTATATIAAPSAPPGAASVSSSPKGAAAGPPAFDAARAVAHIQKLAGDIGPRVAGSEAEQIAVDYIAGQFRSAGYTVELSPFTFTDDPYRPSAVTTPDGKREANTMQGSPGGTVSAAAVFVGLADDAGIARQSLTGKIAVADRGQLDFRVKHDNVVQAGAAALVIIGTDDNVFTGALNTQGKVPVVSLTHTDGEAVRSAAKAGGNLTVTVPDPQSTHSTNVLARAIPGGRCDVLVGGHHDTVPKAPGAHDNASGASAVLELARAFAADGLDPGLCFATFGAEESGLHGSEAMAQAMKAAGTLPRYYVNLDAVGEGTLVTLIGSPELQADAANVAQRIGVATKPEQLGAAFGSDHQSFEKLGVPVIYFATDSLGKFHTPLDIPAEIQPDEVARVGKLAQAYINELLHKPG
jgi:aminopeptidase YwaD